jgi:phage terminase large subunit-like protein
MKLYEFMCNPELCGSAFLGDSWATWRIIARLYDGDAALLTVEEQAIARELTGLDVLPDEAPGELFIGAGRRSGKTRVVSVIGTHAAATDYRDRLAPGEMAIVSLVAPDRRQARTLFGYCAGIVHESAILRAELVNETADSLEFAHRTRLEIHTGSFRAVRGYTMAAAVIDEAAFLRDDRSANPDIELARALRPALATLNGRLVVISSLHRQRGLMFDAYKRYFGAKAAA